MKSNCIANVILLLFLLESDLLILRVNSFIASYSCGVRANKGPFRVGELFVSTNYNNNDDSRGGNKQSNSNLKQLIAKIAQTEQDLEQRLMKLARTEKDLLAQIAVKEQELEQQSQRKPSSQGTNSRIFFSSQMNGSRLNVDDVFDTTTIDVPIGGGSSSARTTSMPFNRPKSRDNSSNNAKEPSLDFSEDVRKSIITGYFIYAIGLGSTLALQAAIQAYPEEWASFVTKTQTRVQSATAPITTAAATLQDLIEDTLSSTRDGVSNSVESTTNAVLDTLQAGASMVESTRTTLDMTKERAADNVEATANAVLDKLKRGLNLFEEIDILQQKAPLAPTNQIATNENVMRNEAEVALDSLRAAEASVANEIIRTGSSAYENSGTAVVEPPTKNELTMIKNNLADDVGTSITSSAEVQSRVESVYEEVSPNAPVAPTFSNDNFETKFMEESVKTDVNPVAAVTLTLSKDNLEVQKDVNPIAAVALTLSDDNLKMKVMEEGVSKEVNPVAAVTPTLSNDNLEMKIMEESVDKEVNPIAAVASTLSKDNLEMKIMEETGANILPQQETGSALAPTEKQTTPAPLQQNVKEELLVELPSPISTITSSDNSLANKENVMKFSSQSTSDTFDANNKGEITVGAAEASIINVAEPSKFDDTQPPLMIQTNTAPEDALREAAVNTFLEALLAGEVSADSLAKVDSAIDLYLQHLRQ